MYLIELVRKLFIFLSNCNIITFSFTFFIIILLCFMFVLFMNMHVFLYLASTYLTFQMIKILEFVFLKRLNLNFDLDPFKSIHPLSLLIPFFRIFSYVFNKFPFLPIIWFKNLNIERINGVDKIFFIFSTHLLLHIVLTIIFGFLFIKIKFLFFIYMFKLNLIYVVLHIFLPIKPFFLGYVCEYLLSDLSFLDGIQTENIFSWFLVIAFLYGYIEKVYYGVYLWILKAFNA